MLGKKVWFHHSVRVAHGTRLRKLASECGAVVVEKLNVHVAFAVQPDDIGTNRHGVTELTVEAFEHQAASAMRKYRSDVKDDMGFAMNRKPRRKRKRKKAAATAPPAPPPPSTHSAGRFVPSQVIQPNPTATYDEGQAELVALESMAKELEAFLEKCTGLPGESVELDCIYWTSSDQIQQLRRWAIVLAHHGLL